MAEKLNNLARIPVRGVGSYSSEKETHSNWENREPFPVATLQFTNDVGNFSSLLQPLVSLSIAH